MPNYYAKSELVQNAQLKAQELCLPLSIVGSGTPANVIVSVDDPAILFLKTEGVDKITPALSPADGSPALAAQVDANGTFSAMIKLDEQVGKVLCAQLIRRNQHGVDTAKLAAVTGISAAGDKILLDCDTGLDLSSQLLDACLIVKYVAKEN